MLNLPTLPVSCALHPLKVALLAAFTLAQPVYGATWTWSGNTNANWSNPGNWLEDSPPVSASDTELMFDAAGAPSSVNDVVGDFTLHGLTLGPTAASPRLSGNAIRFQGAGTYLTMLTSSGHAVVSNALIVDDDLQIAGGSSLTSQLFLQGAISGNGGLQLISGTTVISGNNRFSGATRVAAGATLGIAGGALAGSSSLQVAHGGELQIIHSNVSTTLNNPIALGGVLSSSAGFVRTPLGQFAGGNVNGPITLIDHADITALSGTASRPVRFNVNGAVDRAGHALNLVTDGANNQLNINAINGAGNLTVRPDGGSISVGAVTGAGTLTATGLGGAATIASLTGDGGILVDFATNSGGQLTITGALSGQRDIDVRGGTLNLGTVVPLNVMGQIKLSGQGTLSVGRESYLGNASPVLQFDNGGELILRDGLGLTRDMVTMGGRGRVLFGGSNNLVSGNISGTGGLFVGSASGSPTITLSGNNRFTGGLAIANPGTVNSAGIPDTTTVRFSQDSNLGDAAGAILLGGTLVLPDAYTLGRQLTVSGTAATLNAAGDHTLNGTLSGDGRLNLTGAARYFLTGNATHTGGVALAGQSSGQAAVVVIDSDARLGGSNGVFNIGRVDPRNALAVQAGTLVAAANLDIAATRSTSFRNMTVDTNGFNVVFNQAISGLGMTKTGLGTWTLNTANSNNSNDNRVQVLQGTLALGTDEALATRANVSLASDARLSLGGHVLGPKSLDTQVGSTVDLGQGGRLAPLFGELNGTLTGLGRLVVGRAGFVPASVTLNGANNFIGGVQVTHGSRLSLGHVDALGASGNQISLDNGTLVALASLSAPLVINDATPLDIGVGGAGFAARGQSILLERTLTGPLRLNIQEGSLPGTTEKYDVRLVSRQNQFVGDVILGDPQGFGAAVVGITADGSLGATTNRLILGKRVFDGESTRSAIGGLRAWDGLTLAASRIVLLDGQEGDTAGFIDTNGHTVVVAGSIGELNTQLGLLKTGAGTLVLNGNQSYTGLTTVDSGALGGHGEVEQLVVNNATLTPGESAGLFRVRQDVRMQAGVLDMELGGLVRGVEYDAIDVGGLLDIGVDTLLHVRFIDGFQAQAGDQFALVDADTDVLGSFANVANGDRLSVLGGGSFRVRYGIGLGVSLSDFQSAVPVPEPTNSALMLIGLLGIVGAVRFRRVKQQ